MTKAEFIAAITAAPDDAPLFIDVGASVMLSVLSVDIEDENGRPTIFLTTRDFRAITGGSCMGH